MLHTVNVALSPWTIASLTLSESGLQSLVLRSSQFTEGGLTIELSRQALLRLAELLYHAQRAQDKGLILDIELIPLLKTRDELVKGFEADVRLPY